MSPDSRFWDVSLLDRERQVGGWELSMKASKHQLEPSGSPSCRPEESLPLSWDLEMASPQPKAGWVMSIMILLIFFLATRFGLCKQWALVPHA